MTKRWMLWAGVASLMFAVGCGGALELEDWQDEEALVEVEDVVDAADLSEHSYELTQFTNRAAEAQFLTLINGERTKRGLGALKVCGEVRAVARKWSVKMDADNKLYHNPNFSSQITQWTVLGENVGRGTAVAGLHTAFMNSPGHRANILKPEYTQVGIGVELREGRMWTTHNFRRPASGASCAALGPARPVVVRDGRWHQRYSLLAGAADRSYDFGHVSGTPVMGDWNKNGLATPGVFRNGTWQLRNPNSGGAASTSFVFGASGDKPVVGDWNGDGRTTVGYVRGNTWYLRNSNSAGPADIVFKYGNSTDKVVVGDWNGDGKQTPGVVRGATWYLRNANSAGAANSTFDYGKSTDLPVVGDWNGNGKQTPGVVRGNRWYMKGVGYSYLFGKSTDKRLVAGR